MPFSRVDFHPQRLYPRYARLAATSARSRTTFKVFRSTFSLAWDPTSTESERITAEEFATTQLAIIGYPRTGTTFLQFAMEQETLFHGNVFKNHDPFSIRYLSSLGMPVLVPLRNPVDTCISWSFYNQDPVNRKSAVRRLASYIAWHRVAQRKVTLENVYPIRFEDFTRDLSCIPSPLLTRIGIPSTYQPIPIQSVKIKFAESQNNLDLSIQMANNPTDARLRETQPYRAVYEDLSHHRLMLKAQRIYRELCAVAANI
jgi:hypothetical protein